MAKTNPCQICGEVTAAEFTLAAAFPQASWFAFEDGTPQLVTNICEGCLINAAYQRTVQLAEVEAREGALETIEQTEDLEPVGAPPEEHRSPKSRKTQTQEQEEPAPAAAPAAAD